MAKKKAVAKKETAKKTAPKKTAPKKETAKKAVEKQVVGVDAIVEEVVLSTGVTKKEAEAVIRATFDGIMNLNAEGKNVQIIGFGNFEVRERGERKGRNPQTGEELTIEASLSPALKTGGTYKKRVKAQEPERKVFEAPKAKEEEVEIDEETVEEVKETAKKKPSKRKKRKGSKK